MLGDPAAAKVHYERAIEVCTRLRLRPELADTQTFVSTRAISGGSATLDPASFPPRLPDFLAGCGYLGLDLLRSQHRRSRPNASEQLIKALPPFLFRYGAPRACDQRWVGYPSTYQVFAQRLTDQVRKGPLVLNGHVAQQAGLSLVEVDIGPFQTGARYIMVYSWYQG